MESVLLDVAGHRRSPATMPGYHRGRPPRNKGEQYPADPPTVEEIVAVMRSFGDRSDGHRLRALIVLLWRAGLRIREALSLQETDLDRSRGAVLVRRGKGAKRREVGMDRWAWEQLDPWLDIRASRASNAAARIASIRSPRPSGVPSQAQVIVCPLPDHVLPRRRRGRTGIGELVELAIPVPVGIFAVEVVFRPDLARDHRGVLPQLRPLGIADACLPIADWSHRRRWL